MCCLITDKFLELYYLIEKNQPIFILCGIIVVKSIETWLKNMYFFHHKRNAHSKSLTIKILKVGNMKAIGILQNLKIKEVRM